MDTWWALGHGWLVMTYTDCSSIERYELDLPSSDAFDAAVTRAYAAHTTSLPEAVRTSLLNELRNSRGVAADAEPAVFIRNEWHERRELVARMRPQIASLADLSAQAFRQAGGDERVLELLNDDLLVNENVDRVVAGLNKLPAVACADRASAAAAATEREPQQRPAVDVNDVRRAAPGIPTSPIRAQLVEHVSRVVMHRIEEEWVESVTDYLIRRGVFAVALSEPGPAATSLADVRRAMASFAQTPRCPPILRYIIPGATGELFAEPPPHRIRDRSALLHRLEAEHAQHLASLAGFGVAAQDVCRSIELGVLLLMPDPADYPKPSPMAAALRIMAALEEDLRRLAEESDRMSDVERVATFHARITQLRWKHSFSRPESRPPRQPLVPRRGIAVGSAQPEGEPEPSPLDPASIERLAWEQVAGERWLDAHRVPWHELVMPVIQSCIDLGELAKKHNIGAEFIALTLTARSELWQHPLMGPTESALATLGRIEGDIHLLAARVTVADPQDAAHSRGGPSSRGKEAAPPSVGQRIARDRTSSNRPSATAIDAAAKSLLMSALQSAAAAGQPYVPTRADMTRAVSKEIRYDLTIETLFGTTTRRGERVDRHPEFMKLWQNVRKGQEDAKRERETGG